MAESVYEGMFILDAGRYGRDPDGVSGQIPKMIQDAGGEILVSRLWEERRLAYAINGHRKGAYWLTYFRLDGSKLPALERKGQLSDTILRMLILKVDPRIVDALVEHAKAGPAPRRTGPPGAGRPGAGPPADGKKPAPAEETPAAETAVAEETPVEPAEPTEPASPEPAGE